MISLFPSYCASFLCQNNWALLKMIFGVITIDCMPMIIASQLNTYTLLPFFFLILQLDPQSLFLLTWLELNCQQGPLWEGGRPE